MGRLSSPARASTLTAIRPKASLSGLRPDNAAKRERGLFPFRVRGLGLGKWGSLPVWRRERSNKGKVSESEEACVFEDEKILGGSFRLRDRRARYGKPSVIMKKAADGSRTPRPVGGTDG